MKIYGHPWSIHTRDVLMTLAEKGHEAELVTVVLPKGEHKQPEHMARHPFGKVPVLDDDGFVLYEARAISAYLDRKLSGPALVPQGAKGAAEVDRWTNVADAYFVPFAAPLVVEKTFRKYLGGETNEQAIDAGRAGMIAALDVADRRLASSPYFAGDAFSLADVHWMPYVEYLGRIGEAGPIEARKGLRAWWERVSARDTWRRVARTGPQP
ncbi:MAG TPA: glutathione S-transferase N-terminal domain-containing protein [Byssovorax sp.]|jgi:glutathione S-transferase